MRILNDAGECLFEAIKGENGKLEYKFYNKALEKDLSKNGVRIPDYAKEIYGGRTYVKINDPDFLPALQVFYVKKVLDKCKWEE